MKFGRWSRSIARIITTIKEIAFKHFPHQNNWKLFVIGWQNGNRFDIEFGVIRFWLKYSSVNARRVKNDNQWTTAVWARSPKTSNQKKKCWSASHSFMAHLKCWCGVHCGLGTKIQIDFFYNILLEWWYLCQPRYGLAFFDLNVGRDLKWKKKKQNAVNQMCQSNKSTGK